MGAVETETTWPRVTPRQRDVIRLLLAGLGEKEIASSLQISRHTVHNHVRALYRAFKVTSRFELFARCLQLHATTGAPLAGGDPPPFAPVEISVSADAAQIILEHVPDVIMQLDARGTIRFLNRALPPRTRADLIGTNIAEWLEREDRIRFSEALDSAMQDGRQQDCFVAAPDESRYHIRMQAMGASGEDRIVIATARELNPDAAEAPRNRTAPGASIDDEGLRAGLDHAPDRILILDRRFNITYANRRAGGTPFDWVLPEYHADLRDLFRVVFATGQMRELNVAARASDGAVRRYDARVSAVRADDEVDSIIIIARSQPGLG